MPAYAKKNVSAQKAATLVKNAVDKEGLSLNRVAQMCQVSTPTILRIYNGEAKTLHRGTAERIESTLSGQGTTNLVERRRMSPEEIDSLLARVVKILRRELTKNL